MTWAVPGTHNANHVVGRSRIPGSWSHANPGQMDDLHVAGLEKTSRAGSVVGVWAWART